MSNTNKAEELAQWVIDNRYPKSELDKTSDLEMYHYIVDKFKSYRQSEIDELTKEVERLRKEREFFIKMIKRKQQLNENSDMDFGVGDLD